MKRNTFVGRIAYFTQIQTKNEKKPFLVDFEVFLDILMLNYNKFINKIINFLYFIIINNIDIKWL